MNDQMTLGMFALQAAPFSREAFDRAMDAPQGAPPLWLCLDLFERAAREGHVDRVAAIAGEARRPWRVRATAARVMLRRGMPGVREVLHGMLRVEDTRARVVACEALRETPDIASIPVLCAALDDPGHVTDLWGVERVSNLAALGLAALAEGRAHPALARWLDARRMELSAEDRTTRHLAIMVLAELGDPRAIDAARRERDRDDTFGEYVDLLSRIEASPSGVEPHSPA